MQVNPPKGWGLLQGRVTDLGSNSPVTGATVQMYTQCSSASTGSCGGPSFALTAGADGFYQWWLPATDGPVQVIAAKDGWVQQIRVGPVAGGAGIGVLPGMPRANLYESTASTVVNFELPKYQPPLR